MKIICTDEISYLQRHFVVINVSGKIREELREAACDCDNDILVKSSESCDSLCALCNSHLRFVQCKMPTHFRQLMTYSNVEAVRKFPDDEGAEWLGHKVFHPVEKQHMIRSFHGDQAISWVSLLSSAADIELLIFFRDSVL